MTLTLFNQYGIYPSAITGPTLDGLVFSITTTASSKTLTIPVAGGGFNALIDWGDGTTTTVTTTGNKTHNYSVVGTYQIQITGTFPFFDNGSNAVSNALITSVDSLSTGMLTSLDFSFYWAVNLASVNASFNTTGVTSFRYAWYTCRALSSFPLINTSSGTDFYNTWSGCQLLTSFPLIDTSAGTSFRQAWSGCAALTSFPLINTSAGTNFNGTWTNCRGLTSFPLINTSSGTDFSYAWYTCNSLTSFPAIDTSSATTFSFAWYNCSSLTSFPLLDVSSMVSFNSAWYNCTSLTSFPANMFDTCTATVFTNAFRNCALSQTSVDNILISIDTAGQSNGSLHMYGGTSATPSAAGITAKNSLIAKGWTVSTN